MQEIEIPKTLDDPIKLLIWDIRDVVPVVICVILGILTGTLGKFLLLGVVLSYVSKRTRGRRQDGWGLHFVYWLGILPDRHLPNPYIRRFLP